MERAEAAAHVPERNEVASLHVEAELTTMSQSNPGGPGNNKTAQHMKGRTHTNASPLRNPGTEADSSKGTP